MKTATTTSAPAPGRLAPAAAAVLLVAFCAVPGAAQETLPARVRLFVNGGAFLGSIDYSESLGYEQFGARSTFDADYSAGPTAGFELGGQVRLWKHLGLAISFTGTDRKGDAEVRTTLPLPPALGGSADVTAEGGGFQVDEEAFHFDLVYSHRAGAIELAAFAGVTRSSVVAGVLGDLRTSVDIALEAPPSVSAIAVPRTLSSSATGFNVGGGIDVVLGTFGLGAQLRYHRATVSLLGEAEGRLAAHSLEVDAGGLQIAGGLRIFF